MAGLTASAARANFAELLGRVAYGKERITIERRGKALVALVPLDDLHHLAALEGAGNGTGEAPAGEAENSPAGATDGVAPYAYSAAQSAAELHAANRTLEHEIAERTTAEERLRHSELRARTAEAQLREAIESITDAFVLYDAAGRLVVCNGAFRTLYSYSEAEAAPGTHARDLGRLDVERGLVVVEDSPDAYFSWRDSFWDPPRSRYQLRLANGRHIDIADRRTDSGGLLSIQRDITEQTEAHEALVEREALLRHAQTMARLGSFVWDDVTDSCLYCSEELAALSGLTVEEFLDQRGTHERLIERIHPDDRTHYETCIEAANQSCAAYDMEYRVYCDDGTLTHWREIGEPIADEDGRVVRTSGTIQDITEFKRAEATARESEQRFRHFAETASDWFWEMDETLRFTYFSERYQTSGFDQDDRLGKTRFETAAENLNQAKWHQHRADLEARRPFRDLQYWIATRAGKARFMSVSGNPTFDGKGRFAGYRGTASDITERKRAEDALRQSEARFQAFLNHSPAAIGMKDARGVYVLANKGFEIIHGATGKEPIGKTAHDLMPKHVADAITAHDRSVLQSGTAVQQEIVIPDEGGERTFLTVKFPIPDLGSGSAGIGAIATEITHGKKIGEELRSSEERLRQATQLAGLGYWVWDAATDECLYCSEEHAMIHGLSVADYIDRSSTLDGDFLLTHPDDRDRVRATFAELRRGRPFEMEYRVVTPSGEVRYVHEIAKPVFDASGQVAQEVGTSRDVTDQKLAEEQLLQAQKMEALGYLTGGVAHDFNNLLAVISGNAELLGDDLGAEDRRVQSVLHAAGRGAELTQRLLAFSRRQPLSPKPVAIDALVNHMSELLERTMGKAITIEVSNAADLWLAMVDAGQVENALLNLAINARDATPHGGTVTIETANLRVDARNAADCPNLSTGDYVALAVRDTGSGIAPEVLDHIFEPFFTTKDVGQGSGLGLSMVYGFAEQSGGTVTVDSTPRQGATFRLYLPRARGEGGNAKL